MKEELLYRLVEKWEALPNLDQDNFLNEGLAEVAHQSILYLCSDRSDDDLKVEFNKVKEDFSQMSKEQTTYFLDQIESHVSSLILKEEGYEDFNSRFLSFRQIVLQES